MSDTTRAADRGASPVGERERVAQLIEQAFKNEQAWEKCREDLVLPEQWADRILSVLSGCRCAARLREERARRLGTNNPLTWTAAACWLDEHPNETRGGE